MGLIANEIITQVINASDIVATIGNYTALKKAGRNYKALCPFHTEKSSSFVVNPDKQIFHCFGCGVGGNVIGFIMRQEHLEFPQAVRFLAEKAGITIPETDGTHQGPSRQIKDEIVRVNQLAVDFFHEQLLTNRDEGSQKARDYLKARGVTLETVKKFQLGFALDEWDALLKFLRSKNIAESLIAQAGLIIAREGKPGYYDRFRNRVIFPIFDIQSRAVAFGARAMNDTDGAKYINSPETPVYTKGQHLFGLNLTKTAVGKLDRLIVVEGYMDMIMPFVHGVEPIAASLGTALTVEQIRLIRRYTTNVVMLFDTDPAGQSAIIRSLDSLIDEGMNVRVVTLSSNQDPDSFIREFGLERFNERLTQAQSLFDYKFAWLATQYDGNSVEGRAQICQHMLTTINRYKDEVVKYELSKQLGRRLNLPDSVIFKQAQQLPKPAQPVVLPTVPTVKPKSIKPKAAEELLLALFLKDPLWVNEARTVISPEEFTEGPMRDMIEAIWQLSDVQPEWSINDLILRINDEPSQNLLAKLGSQEEAKFGNMRQAFDDCVARFQKERVDVQKQGIQKALRLAEANNDQAAVEQLTQQFNALIKQ